VDRRFIDYYNRELAYMRELGSEFAEAYPKIGARLGMLDGEVADPFVERLLEGFAFLTARIQLKMDAEFPRFSQQLLEVVYPHYLAPTPAMAIVQFSLLPGNSPNMAGTSNSVPRGSALRSGPLPDTETRCTFVTTSDVELWPYEVASVQVGAPGSTPEFSNLPQIGRAAGVVRFRLQRLKGLAEGLPIPDKMVVHLAGDDVIASHLFEAIVGNCVGLLVGESGSNTYRTLPCAALMAEGLHPDQAMLPGDSRVFQGYRLLHEYFAFPQRFLFFSIGGLQEVFAQIEQDDVEVIIVVGRELSSLAGRVDRNSLALNCTPVINLFNSKGMRLRVEQAGTDHHVVPDRCRPLDYEVYRVDAVEGMDRGNRSVRKFYPFYDYTGSATVANEAYFSVRREPRRLSESAKSSGLRSGYHGGEVYVSLVDANEAPWPESIEQLSVDMLLTNRDLPILIPVGSGAQFEVLGDRPVGPARILRGPTRPRNSIAEREMTWRLVSHLSLNYLALKDLDPASGAAQLRELLGLYAALGDPAVGEQVEAIAATRVRAATRRMPVSGPMVFGRGIEVTLVIDERPFAGVNPYLFGSIVECFLARHISMNLFCEVRMESTQRGEIGRWPPRWGGRPDA
jgi:type VI secretion system protein ImpG